MILLNDVVEVATAPHPYAFPLHAGSCPCLFGRSAGGERCVRSEARIRATRRHQISRVGIGSSHDHWRADVCYVGSNAGGYSHAASIFSNRFRAISITSTLSSAHSHSALMGTHILNHTRVPPVSTTCLLATPHRMTILLLRLLINTGGYVNDTWLITGSSVGLGRSIVEAALAAGHNFVGVLPHAAKYHILTQFG